MPDQPHAIKSARGLTPLPKSLNKQNAEAVVAKLVKSEAEKDNALQAAEEHHKFIQSLFNKPRTK